MIDAEYSRQGPQEDRTAVMRTRRRVIISLVAGLVLIGCGWMIVWPFGGSKAVAPLPDTVSATSVKPSDELLETAKGLQVTQQQAVDQLQVVQDQLAAQQVETKELSGQVAALTEKLDALKQSVADIATPSAAAPVPLLQPSKARGK